VLYANASYIVRHSIASEVDTVLVRDRGSDIAVVDYEYSENGCLYWADNEKSLIQVGLYTYILISIFLFDPDRSNSTYKIMLKEISTST